MSSPLPAVRNELGSRAPDFIRQFLPLFWLIASFWFPLPAKITVQVLDPIDLRARFGAEPDWNAAGPPAGGAHLVDPDRHLEFVNGMTRWKAEGEKRTGLGARFAMRMRVGAVDRQSAEAVKTTLGDRARRNTSRRCAGAVAAESQDLER